MNLTVWVSSIKHLQRFSTIAPDGVTANEIKVRLPKNFPQMTINQYNIPLVMISEGKLIVEENSISFTAKRKNSFLMALQKYKNLDYNLSFKLDISEINCIARYHHIDIISKYNIHWIRLMHSSEKTINNLLISCRGYGCFTKVHNKNDKLHIFLKELIEKNNV
ncbi:hypothetical protein [Vallitalea guaymasensis]|uniref:hypothetical protein n=1 Tax=Vallitalea guaymasensis TaxID=1185412 RepID=UPI0012900E0B|nr:hypothetical protein [Vallitalea guaymasensis]